MTFLLEQPWSFNSLIYLTLAYNLPFLCNLQALITMKLTYSHLILGLLFLSVSLAGNAASDADLPCTNPIIFTWIDHECSDNTFRVIVDLQFGGSAAFYDIF
jgi:hypothetical protein